MPETFASVLGGDITEFPQKEPDIPIVDFQWNGFATRVGLISDSFITGKSVADPRQRCEEFGSGGQPCEPGRVPGSFEQSMTWTGPPVDGGVTTRLLTVYFAEGWDVTVMVSNAADSKNSPVLTPDVPLTLDQLREVAYSRCLVPVGLSAPRAAGPTRPAAGWPASPCGPGRAASECGSRARSRWSGSR